MSSPAVGRDGTIYVGQTDRLYALSPAGATNWSIATGGSWMTTPALGVDGVIYVHAVSTNADRMLAVSPSGTTNWTFTIAGNTPPVDSFQLASSPAIGPDGTIYVGSGSGQLAAVTPEGQTNWIFTTVEPIHSPPAIGGDGTVYIGCDFGVVYAIAAGGVLKWAYPQVLSAGGPYQVFVVVGKDGTIFVSSAAGPGSFYALNPDGTVQWSWAANRGTASAAIAEGRIYVPSSEFADGAPPKFSALAYPSFGTLWTFNPPTGIWSSPAIGADGTVYFGCDTELFALYATNAVQDAPWPMFGRDAAHQSRAIQRAIRSPGFASNSFYMTLVVETDRVYTVEGSVDLLDWTELTNFTPTNPKTVFVDKAAGGLAQRFYRLRTQ
jgi:outer membrane protein assembly factor BamB